MAFRLESPPGGLGFIWGLCSRPILKTLPRELYRESVPLSLIFLRGRSVSGIPISRALAREGLCVKPLSPKLWLGGGLFVDPRPGPPLAPSLYQSAAVASHPTPHQQRRRLPPEPPSPALLTLAAALRDIQGPGAPASRRPGWVRIPECCCCEVAAAAARSDAGRGRGPRDGAGCTRASLLRSPRIPFRGRGSAPPA